MTAQPQVLIVTSSQALADNLLAWVAPQGYRAVLATTFESGAWHLQKNPRLVITQLRLHDYNGLHLALHAREAGIPTVVVGDPDAVLERDAEQLGAKFVKCDGLHREQILALLRDLAPMSN